ncbi:type I toxin-antitoxin system Ibs family toxin [Escherichia coli]|nr:type I toxin-antitoxin system Ibs family toxin [Escherichia coli]EET6416202.1 type I toxin-antitoxin system Ibs family toxin [Escherichia coli]EET6681931.1 type I toxin-antitoxin system Ibs family toxin [Escherichia coli]EET7208234.1 type I toxin-antitoxin system Ibs family toxin [Escherichia coli]EET9520219.1 type I toxin-antitoxin system Ibs family toxin [Escherichia coli]EEX8911570.1 type I toxin-antitoxin system Ibs family toxin [Escherichia coli]
MMKLFIILIVLLIVSFAAY